MSKEISKVIFQALVSDSEYLVKVLPHLKPEYFEGSAEKEIFTVIEKLSKTYKTLPTKSVVEIEIEDIKTNEKTYRECKLLIAEIFQELVCDREWLYDISLKFCKEQALHDALKQAIVIAEQVKDGTNKISETKIPEILAEALAVDFNTEIGQDYIDDASDRFERYQKLEEKLPFALQVYNDITGGGCNKGFLHVLIGGTSSGKSLHMCSLACDDLRLGYDVLYITLELDHDIIAKRIDANIMDIDFNEIHVLDRQSYVNNINSLKKRTLGKLKILEDFSGRFNDNKLKRVLDELKLKKDFVPTKVYIDYLGLCKSSIYKEGSVNTNTYYGSIAQELRNVCRTYNFSLWTAMQFNRGSYSDSDADITGIADSWGVTNHSDWIGMILAGPELQEINQIEIKQGKTKYSDLSENNRFYLGIDKKRMKVYELGSNLNRLNSVENERYGELNYN